MRKCDNPSHHRVFYCNGTKSNCYECQKERQKKYSSVAGYGKRKYEREKSKDGYKERVASRRRKKAYGSPDAPSGKCQICKIKDAKAVDHDHTTGKIRGYLCIICNVRLAVLENTEFTTAANEYLRGK